MSAVAGAICLKKPGEEVRAGEPILELRSDDPARFAAARDALEGAIDIDNEPKAPLPLVVERISA